MATTDIDVRDLEQRGIDVIRGLSMDAVQKANSGHPGTPMALAPLAHVLFTRIMKYDAADPTWPDRDRFVLSNGHASMLLYSLLYLTGYGLTLDDIRDFRQWGSKTAGHPEYTPRRRHRGHHRTARSGLRQRRRHRAGRGQPARPLRRGGRRPPHVRVLRRRRPRGGREPRGGVDRRAPRARPPDLRLRRQPHHASTARPSSPTPTTCRSGSRPTAGTSCSSARSPTTSTRSSAGSAEAMAETARPSLVVLRSHIGYPSPKYTDTAKAHGEALGADEVARGQGDPRAPRRRTSTSPTTCVEFYREAGTRGRAAREAWEQRRAAFARVRARDGRRSSTRATRAAASPGWESELPVWKEGEELATRAACAQGRQRGARRRARPGRGRADLTGNTGMALDGRADHRHARVRRSPASTTASASTAWAAVMNGMAVSWPACPRAAPSSCSATTCAARCGSPRSRSTSRCSCGPTTPSVSARTVRPTSRSSSSRRCGRCRGCGSSVPPTPTR